MSDTTPKRLFLLLIAAVCLLICSHQVSSLGLGQPETLMETNSDNLLITYYRNRDRSDIQKADIFRNEKGLRDKITIQGPIKEMNVISKTKTDTIEELIEDISLWIPQMYREQFSINPRCIIILETKLNEDEKAEVRFAVAMECRPKVRPTKTIRI